MKNKAFTLAEVLITLVIIGVVAALTIATVISDYTQSEYKAGLKKAVSVLNSAIQMNISEDGETPYENDDLFQYLQRHMSVIANTNYFYNDVFSGAVNYSFYTTDGMRFEFPQSGFVNTRGASVNFHETGEPIDISYGYVPSSMQLRFTPKQGYCGSYGLKENKQNTINRPCIVLVDVNGERKPSTLGANRSDSTYFWEQFQTYYYPSVNDSLLTDIFLILITEDRAIPFGVVAQRAMYENK